MDYFKGLFKVIMYSIAYIGLLGVIMVLVYLVDIMVDNEVVTLISGLFITIVFMYTLFYFVEKRS